MDGQKIIQQIERIRQRLDESEPNDPNVSIKKTDLGGLLNQYSLLHVICERMPDAADIKDLKGRYILINKPGAHLFKKSVEEILGKDATELYTSDLAHRIMEEERSVVESGMPSTFEDTNGETGGERIRRHSVHALYRRGVALHTR